MEFLSQWLGINADIIGSFQIVLDLVILVVLCFVFFNGKRSRGTLGNGEFVESLQKVIVETKAIGSEFERNLNERQMVIQQILTKLDHRLKEAEGLCARLESLREEGRKTSNAQKTTPNHSEHRQVLLLAQKGLDAEAIARRLQKPLGEVELILNLERMSAAK